eukprot:COSAG01_NODE_946_length_12533_cov_4.570532_4_plen_63_part_00
MCVRLGTDRSASHIDIHACVHVRASQWDVQELVKTVGELLKQKGVPVWMDISGGMGSDIYDR